MTQRRCTSQLVDRGAEPRVAGFRQLCYLKDCSQSPPSAFTPSHDLIPPAAVIPADHEAVRRMLVQEEIEGAECGRCSHRGPELYANTTVACRDSNEAKIQ